MKKQWLIRTAMIASVVLIASAFVYAVSTTNSNKENNLSVTQTITKGEKASMMSPKCDDGKSTSTETSDKKCNSGEKSDSTSSSKCNDGKDASKDSKCGEGKCNDSKKESDKK